MKRKSLLLAGLTLVSAVVVATLLLFTPDQRRFTKEHHQQLKTGMTREEMTIVLGVSPGDYTQGKGYYRDDDLFWAADPLGWDERSACWCGQEGAIIVWFDKNGRAWNISHADAWPPRPTLWQRVQTWWGGVKQRQ